MRDQRTRVITDIALAVALSVVLNLMALRLPINVAGGSISLTMLPIAVVALRRGAVAAAIAGLLFGCFDLLMEPVILVPTQVLLDYPVPYLLFGIVCGLFAPVYQRTQRWALRKAVPDTAQSAATNRPGSGRATELASSLVGGSAWIVIAVLLAGFVRYLTHVFSGVIFFAEYAGDQNVWLYSLLYNFAYLGPSLLCVLMCSLVLLPLLSRQLPVESVPLKRARFSS
ncbi:MAG: energy-coupled thiamine transporter ThiT [Coriobacteriales bacterium]|nr:energy-coupled thiamine transporter ThiT [Coriobacteriales bacterium]